MRIWWLSLLLISPALAQETSPAPSNLEQRLEELEQSHRILLRKLELAEEERAAKPPSVLSVGSQGIALKSPDGKTQLKLRALVQVDGRAYLGDDKHSIPDTFLLRRVRPILDATFFGFLDVRIMPDFGQNTVKLFDAYIDLHPWPWLRLRAGKFKPPVGLERLQSAANIRFIERALPTAVVPNRDLGVQLWGEVAGGTLIWAIGAFNGVVDGSDNPDVDTHDGKDFAARVFLHPLRPLKIAALDNLGLGVSATYGSERSNNSQLNLPSYKSPGQVTFYSYPSDVSKFAGAVYADGDRWRVSPQLYYYVGPFGLLAEYVRSTNDVLRGTKRASIKAEAWQLQLSVLLTPGDKESFENIVPRRPVGSRHGYGAFELVARYSELQVYGDGHLFEFVDYAKAARHARELGVGLNWWASEIFRAGVTFDRTDFVGGAAKGGDRTPENVLIGRLQAMW